jgi:hypothetical protein
MTCPKCEPKKNSRAWLWLVAVAMLVSVAAWLDASTTHHPLRVDPVPDMQKGQQR